MYLCLHGNSQKGATGTCIPASPAHHGVLCFFPCQSVGPLWHRVVAAASIPNSSPAVHLVGTERAVPSISHPDMLWVMGAWLDTWVTSGVQAVLRFCLTTRLSTAADVGCPAEIQRLA